jgi:hypothetical protein
MGAIASITAALRKAGFNILTSLSRLHDHGGRAQFELVLQHSHSHSAAEFRENFEQALADHPVVQELGITVSYDQHYRSAARQMTPLVSGRNNNGPEQVQSNPTARRLTDLCKVFEHRLSLPQPLPDDAIRYDIARRLLKEEIEVRRLGRLPITLFVSYAFKDKKRFARIVREAGERRIEIVTGKKLGQQRVHRDGIIALIRRSTHFVGIWTEEGALPFGDEYLPSPWLTWELGVAEACGIPMRLLISRQIHDESWKRIYPEVPHIVFDAKDELESVRFVLGLIEGERGR